MDFGRGAQMFGSGFWRQVALRLGKHFIADHELAHTGRAQQWRIKMRMQLPMRGIGGGAWRAVPAHRIWKTGLEQIVIGYGDRL